jgi:anti-sigma factor RsiW
MPGRCGEFLRHELQLRGPQVTQAELRAWEEHLRGCEECQKQVELDKAVAAFVVAGKHAKLSPRLKRELSKRVPRKARLPRLSLRGLPLFLLPVVSGFRGLLRLLSFLWTLLHH